MITLKTEVQVKGIAGRAIFDFMMHCTDEHYQQWWPGTHRAFHTIQRLPGDVGNRVYFDEYVGKRRLKFAAIVVESIPDKKIVWQMEKILRLPAWLGLEFSDNHEGVSIAHTLKMGFSGPGNALDPLLGLFCSKRFAKDLEEHAHDEFTRLAEILAQKQQLPAHV
jgi:hypothetical protein